MIATAHSLLPAFSPQPCSLDCFLYQSSNDDGDGEGGGGEDDEDEEDDEELDDKRGVSGGVSTPRHTASFKGRSVSTSARRRLQREDSSDQLNPWADVEHMDALATIGAIIFLAMPTSDVDCLVFNAHRIYGPVRWKLLSRSWEVVDLIGDVGRVGRGQDLVFGGQRHATVSAKFFRFNPRCRTASQRDCCDCAAGRKKDRRCVTATLTIFRFIVGARMLGSSHFISVYFLLSHPPNL